MKECKSKRFFGKLKIIKLGWIYRGVYVAIFFLGIYMFTCYMIKHFCYNNLCINEYTEKSFLLSVFKYIHGISCCNINENPASFGTMMTMQGVCATIIIFLYSRYGQGASGIPTEQLIRYEIGTKTIYLYRLTSLGLPIVSFYFIQIKWYGIAIVCAFFLYAIIGAYVILAANLMMYEQTSKIVKKMLKHEMLCKKKDIELYIKEQIFYGYYKYEYNKKMQKAKISLETTRKVYQALKSEIIYQTFNEKDDYKLTETIKNVYEELAKLDIENTTINFIYMYDLIYHIFTASEGFTQDSILLIIEQIITELNAQNKTYEKNEEYEALYFAVICAIIYLGSKTAKDYLWYDLLLVQDQNNHDLAQNLFFLSLCFIELLRRKGKADPYFKKMIKRNNIKFTDHIYVKKELKKYNFALSILGFGTDACITECFCDVKEDLENLIDKDYLPKTVIGTI